MPPDQPEQTAADFHALNERVATVPTIEPTPSFTVATGSAGTVAFFTGAGVPASNRSALCYNSANNWTVGTNVCLTAIFVAS